VETARFFTATARRVDWIGWLDHRGHVASLFEDKPLQEHETALGWWLAENFAVQRPDHVFELIAAHKTRLNPSFWYMLGREVGLVDRSELTDETLSCWVSLLIAAAPSVPDEHVLSWIGGRCIKRKLTGMTLDVFEAMVGFRLQLKKSLSLFEGAQVEDREPRIDIELESVADHFLLNELWQKGLKPHLSEMAETVLDRATRVLEEQHLALSAWGKEDRNWSVSGFRRSAIEPHEQDEHPEAIDVLIDAARDSLESLAATFPRKAARWMDRLVESDAVLLRRLAVHGAIARNDLSPDQKLRWMMDHTGLHEVPLHHEIYRLVRLNYPSALPQTRSAVVQAVQSYRWPNDGDPERDRRTARVQFDWLSWIASAAPDCELAGKALDAIKTANQKFEPREHPDLTHWMSSGWAAHASPWPVEKLLEKPARAWLVDLLAFKGDEFRGPDREGMLASVGDAAKQVIPWGMELASALAETSNWDSDLWYVLIRAWSEAPLDEDQYRWVLNRVAMPGASKAPSARHS
jgi:hypothetical protein